MRRNREGAHHYRTPLPPLPQPFVVLRTGSSKILLALRCQLGKELVLTLRHLAGSRIGTQISVFFGLHPVCQTLELPLLSWQDRIVLRMKTCRCLQWLESELLPLLCECTLLCSAESRMPPRLLCPFNFVIREFTRVPILECVHVT